MKLRLLLIVVVATLALTVALWRTVPASGRGQRIVVVLPRADGVREGASVTYAGLLVGRVERLRIVDGRVLASIELDRDDAEVRMADTIRLRTLGLLGDKVLDITPGPRAAPLLRGGDTLVALRPPELPLDAMSDSLLRGLGAIGRPAPQASPP
jgi:phospholipid/cholesterol/gamma-HCH transport system substrate-binding protein